MATQKQRIDEAIKVATLRRDRYAEKRVKELTGVLKQASDDVATQIRAFDEAAGLKPWQEMQRERLRLLESQIDEIGQTLQTKWTVGSRSHAEGAAKLGIEEGIDQMKAMQIPDFKSLDDIARNARVMQTFTAMDLSAIDFLANYEVQLLGDVSAALSSQIKGSVTRGILSGASIPDIRREIGRAIVDPEAFKKAGKTIFKTAQQRATLIARTETLRAHNEGRKTFYTDIGVTHVKWIAAHDDRTCEICGPLDGVEFKIGDAPGPPKHPACRCSVIAVIPASWGLDDE